MHVNSVQKTTGDDFAAQLRGFGVTGIVAIVVIMLAGNIVFSNMVAIPLGAVLVLTWARLSLTPLREIGYAKPNNWLVTITGGIVFGVAFKILMKAIIMPLLGADPINHSYHFLAGNKFLLPTAIVAMLVAGFGEETVFRGFMFERMGKFFGDSRGSKILIVLFTSLLFGLSHYSIQGWTGVEQAIITGVAFGTIFAATRNIWVVMIAHAFFDLTALAIIYKNVEFQIAHWIFK
jgi:CAAX protease family protein